MVIHKEKQVSSMRRAFLPLLPKSIQDMLKLNGSCDASIVIIHVIQKRSVTNW
jgi:hypothetical protein